MVKSTVQRKVDEPRPGTSRENEPSAGDEDEIPEDRMERAIREAEQGKTRIFQTPGRELLDLQSSYVHSAMVDQDYYVLAAHLDESVQNKITRGEYVDFAKLIPKDQIITEEEQKLQMVVKGGQTFWTPMNEGLAITSYGKWEQAFRVYMDVYVRAHPGRSSELIQYEHIISTIASQFVWENVYAYDKDFCIHMA